jgi:hypothetical protein
MTTTRNQSLDALSQGQSLGAVPLDKKLGNVKLKLGIVRGGPSGVDRDCTARHVAFGLEHSVDELRKGDRCS